MSKELTQSALVEEIESIIIKAARKAMNTDDNKSVWTEIAEAIAAWSKRAKE